MLQNLANWYPVPLKVHSFAPFTTRLKFEGETGGLQRKTRAQRQGDFKDNFIGSQFCSLNDQTQIWEWNRVITGSN
jgi:hypothetical protein